MVTLSYCSSNSSRFMIFFFSCLFSLSLLKITMFNLEMRYSLLDTRSYIVISDLIIRSSCSEILSTTYSTSGGISQSSSLGSSDLEDSSWAYLMSLRVVALLFGRFYCCSSRLVAFLSLLLLLTLEICWFLTPSRAEIISICSASKLVFQIMARESLPPVAK